MVFPLLPYMLRLQGVSEFWQVAIFSLFSAASFFASPLWGRLSDKIGRKPVICIAMVGSSACIVWLNFSSSAIDIYINRAISGLFAGWLAASQAFIGDWVSKKDRIRGMAMMGIAFGLGFTIGPFSASLLIGENWASNPQFFQAPLLYSFACYIIAIFLVLAFVKDIPMKPQINKATIGQILSQAPIAQSLTMIILFQLAFTAMESTLALWIFDSFGGGPKEIGLLLAVAGIASLLTHGCIVGLGKRFEPMILASIGVLSLCLALLMLQWADSQEQAYIVMIFAAIGHGLFVPSCSGFLSRLAPSGWQGGIMGFVQSCSNLSRIGGPLSGGYLYSALGRNYAYMALIVPLLPSLILAYRLWRAKL